MMPPMRTTVTLDPDTLDLLHKHMRERGLSFKEAVNDAVRTALSPEARKPFKQRTFRMGPMDPAIFNKALQLAGELEDQEIIRKVSKGK